MKKIFFILPLLFVMSCGLPRPYSGFSIVADVKQTDPNASFNVSGKNGPKTGKACVTNILGFYSAGDLSVEVAKQNGGISTISSIRTEIKNSVFVATTCTVVTGY